MDDDAHLANLKRGDPAAVERLVADFEGPLYRYFLAIHGDPALAGDQSADCFAELVRALPKMRGGVDRLRGFVYAVARNVERRRWRQRPAGDQPLESARDTPCPRPGPRDAAAGREQLDLALGAIRQLDATTGEVFVLRFVEQLSLAEVAVALGMPIGSVKSWIHRGRQQLLTLLATEEDSS